MVRNPADIISAGTGNRVEGNNISANDEGGMVILHSDSNVVVGNVIGANPDCNTALGNGYGIWIQGSSNNVVGGPAPGDGNTIAFNTSTGVVITDYFQDGNLVYHAANNSVRGNSIFANGLLGIDLGGDGVTPNDPGDADSGPNNLQNFPVITSATVMGNTVVMTVSVNSRPNTTYTLDFYASASADPSGNGEGERYLGSATVTTDAFGNVTMVITLTAPVSSGEVLTATATDPAGNTSEFSAAFLVQ